MSNVGTEQCRKELDYARHHFSSLVALFSYDSADTMIALNRTRALCSIDCIMEVLADTKEYIEKVL